MKRMMEEQLRLAKEEVNTSFSFFQRFRLYMWSQHAKLIFWVYLSIQILFFFHFHSVYILKNIFCNFEVTSAENEFIIIISRYVQNTTFEIGPFKLSMHIFIAFGFSLKIKKKMVAKMHPMLQCFPVVKKKKSMFFILLPKYCISKS